jgi:hypothetical protein
MVERLSSEQDNDSRRAASAAARPRVVARLGGIGGVRGGAPGSFKDIR